MEYHLSLQITCRPFDICRVCNGYSGSDLTALAKDAALGPIRGIRTYTFISLHLLCVLVPFELVYSVS